MRCVRLAVTACHRWPARQLCSAARSGAGFSGHALHRRTSGPGRGTTDGRGGGGSRQHPLFALPSYRLARKTEEDLEVEAAAGEVKGSNGGRFPFKDEFEVSRGLTISARQVLDTLSPLMTQERQERIAQVCASRSFNVLPVVESCYDMGNLAAVCRSADALGFGAVHVVRNLHDERYKQSKRSSAGADKWLDVQVWDTTEECLLHAKKLGYQVVVTHLSPDAVDISQIDWTRPTAFVMGNEEKGVSDSAVALADACAVVPMVGFVESFNISVAAALIMYEARRCREQKLGAHGDLTPREQELLRAVFYLRNKGQTREYIQHLLDRPPPHWQSFRGGGDWGDKSFSLDGSGSSGSGDEAADGSSSSSSAARPLPVQRLQTTACYYWDGHCCWGERFLWPGKPCRYHGAHNKGVNTFNKEKLKQMCEKKGLAFPDLANPPLLVAAAAEAAASAAAEAAEAEAVATAEAERLREVHEALLATARAAAADPAGAAAA